MSLRYTFQLLVAYFKTFSLRHARRAPWTTSALILIVALGVAVFFSMRLSNRAAIAGFQLFTQSISGGSDFVVSGPGEVLETSQLHVLREKLNPLPVHLLPLIENTASIPGTGKDADGFDAVQVPVIGLDLLAARNLTYARSNIRFQFSNSPTNSTVEFGEANSVFITQALASRLNVQANDSINMIIGDQLASLKIISILIPNDFQAGKSEELLLMDLPALQQLLNQPNNVDRVEVIIPKGFGDLALRNETLQRLQSLPKEEWIWSTTDERKKSSRDMTAAFRLNLTILSTLSLLVGIYLIIQGMEASVVRRRTEIGILLAMGCEPRWIRFVWLVESLMLGVVGSLLGLGLGWLMAQGSVRAVAQTVNTLYLNTTADAAAWNHVEALFAFALGVFATVAAGALPARDAASTKPVQVMQLSSRNMSIRLLDSPKLGIALLFLGAIISFFPPLQIGSGSAFPLGGYLSSMFLLIGAAILASNLLSLIPFLFQKLSDRNVFWRISVSQFRQPSGRQKLATAGLVVAIGMAAGMGILTASFENTVTRWITQSLQSDLYMAVKGIENASSKNRISQSTWQQIMDDPQVENVEIRHTFNIQFQELPTMLLGVRNKKSWSGNNLIWVSQPLTSIDLTKPLSNGSWPSVISESFATHYALERGDNIELPTPDGIKPISILGIYTDFSNERGTLLVDGATLCNWFKDKSAGQLAASIRQDADLAKVRNEWIKKFPSLAIRTNRVLREEVLAIFRQTFSVTQALKAIAIAVAISGLALALFSLLTDRRQELSVMRELGFERKEIAQAVTVEGLLLSVVGLSGGLLLSLALGYILIFVINKQSFGWTLAYSVSATNMITIAIGVLLAAFFTSIGVGYWASRLKGERTE